MSSGANTNSYCCLPTPKGSDPLHPAISYCSPQYNQTDTLGSIPDVVPNNWGNGGSRGWPGAPTWSVAYVIIPGHILQYDNDASLIKTHYSGAEIVLFCAVTLLYKPIVCQDRLGTSIGKVEDERWRVCLFVC